MKHIFLNLKRFDIPREYGGVNGAALWRNGGAIIVQNTQEKLKAYGAEDGVRHVFPGSPSYSGSKSLCEHSPVKTGCQECTGRMMAENAISAHLPPTALPMQLKAMDAVLSLSDTARSAGIRPESWKRPESQMKAQ